MGRKTVIGLCVIILLCATALSCRRDHVLRELYPSQARYPADIYGKEVVLITDSRDEVSIIDDRMLILKVSGTYNPPYEIVIGYMHHNGELRITGYDPKGVYAPFVFYGTSEELFGSEAGACVVAEIMLVTRESEDTYSSNHMRVLSTDIRE